MKKYILFDLDGTLTESAPGIMNSARYALNHFGIPDPGSVFLRKFVGPPLFESFTQMFGLDPEQATEAITVYREYYARQGIFENEVYAGIPEALEMLKKKGFVLAVATSKPEVYAKQILEHFDLAKYFELICGIPLEDEKMTKAQVIERTLRELGVSDKSQALMVGDRDYDVKGAHANGIECVGVLFGYGDRPELEEAGAEYIAVTPAGMGEIIASLG